MVFFDINNNNSSLLVFQSWKDNGKLLKTAMQFLLFFFANFIRTRSNDENIKIYILLIIAYFANSTSTRGNNDNI